MTARPAAIDLMGASDPVALLDETLLRSGGVIRVSAQDGPDTIYFHPTTDRLRRFHRAERTGSLQNHNTPAAEELFAGTVFTLTGDLHRRRRQILIRSFGQHGTWRDDVDAAIADWISTTCARGIVDLLDETRRLAHAVFARVMFGIAPESSCGQDVAGFAAQFVAGAVTAATPKPDRVVLQQALSARDELGRIFTHIQTGPGEAQPTARVDARDLGAILIASIETTANLLGWAIVRWLQIEPSDRGDPDAFAHQVEILDSPNTLITREVVGSFWFEGEQLEPGTLVSYSPASAAGDNLSFGSGVRACPGKGLAQYTVRRTLTELATSTWSLVADGVPHPRSWMPTRTFGCGTLVRTASGEPECQ